MLVISHSRIIGISSPDTDISSIAMEIRRGEGKKTKSIFFVRRPDRRGKAVLKKIAKIYVRPRDWPIENSEVRQGKTSQTTPRRTPGGEGWSYA